MALYPPSTVIPIYAVLIVVSILLTCLRLWVNASKYSNMRKQPFGADDVFILIGLAVAASCSAIQFYNAVEGTAGEAISAQAAHHRAILSHKVDFAMTVVEKLAFGAIKLSLLLFYRHIFGVWASFRAVNNALLVLVAVWTLAFALADLLLCGGHLEVIWALDQTRALHQCGNRGALLIAFAATSIITDGLVLGLPLVYIQKLQITGKKKVGASIAFILGTM